MLKIDYTSLRCTLFILKFCVVAIIISSCGKYNDNVIPVAESAAEALMDNARINSVCNTFIESTQNNIQRNKIIALYGAGGGTRYDQTKAAYLANPTQYVNTYSRIYAYKVKIQNAIASGAASYASQFCNGGAECLAQYSGGELKAKISVFLNPVIANIANDVQLTNFDKQILNSVIQVYNNNFTDIFDNYANAGYSCFPNPSWYPIGAILGGANPAALLGWSKLGKIIKKIINIAATILTEVVENAVYGSIYGALAGVVAGNPAAGFVVGAACGAFYGIISGIDRCMKGGYVCLVGPCN